MMIRHASVGLFLVSSVSQTCRKSSCTTTAPGWSFDTKGFPTQITPVLPNASHHSLLLSGVGMRRKNFYIVDVDVYQLGINLSTTALNKGKEWSKTESPTKSLSDALLDNTKPFTLVTKEKKAPPTAVGNNIRIALTLRFVRSVTKTQFIEAFTDAFSGCTPTGVETFKNSLGQIVDDSGVKQGEEIFFYWMDNGDFTVARNGVLGDTFNLDEINHRLLEVYIDPKRTVSPELSVSIHEFLKNVEF